jgi:hypothetical protein
MIRGQYWDQILYSFQCMFSKKLGCHEFPETFAIWHSYYCLDIELGLEVRTHLIYAFQVVYIIL